MSQVRRRVPEESDHREPGDSLFIRAVSVAGLSYVRPIIRWEVFDGRRSPWRCRGGVVFPAG